MCFVFLLSNRCSYLQNLEDEQLQLALALSASIDSVSPGPTCTAEPESEETGRKRPKKYVFNLDFIILV